MPGASFEAVTGRLGVGAIAFFGLFLIADGTIGVFELIEAIGKSVTWGIIGILPTVVVTYVVGVFCLGIAEVVLSGLPSLSSPKPEDIIAVSKTGSALLQQIYSEHLRNHELLKGTSVSFLILTAGCIAESPNMHGSIAIVWLFTTAAIALAALSLFFSGRAARRAAAIASAAHVQHKSPSNPTIEQDGPQAARLSP
jgi:hypothetical protein